MQYTIGFSVLLLLIAMVSIQSGASMAKQLFPTTGVIGATLLRLSIAALILAVFCRPWKSKLNRIELRAVCIYGASLGCMNLLFYLALERIPLGIAVMIEFLGPLTVALGASRKVVDFCWAVLAATGMVLLIPSVFQMSKVLDPLGVVFALGAALCWALYIIFGKKAVASVEAGKLVAFGMFIAALTVLPAFLAFHGDAAILLNPDILPIAVIVAILSSALPYFLEIFAMKNLPLKFFGILMSLEPAIGALLGSVFLREYLSFVQWIAIGCVVIASSGSSLCTSKHRTHINETRK